MCKYCYHWVQCPIQRDHSLNNNTVLLFLLSLLLLPDCNILVIPSYSSFLQAPCDGNISSPLQCGQPWQRGREGAGQRSTYKQPKHDQTNREVMRSISWHVTQCSPLKIRRRFGGLYCLDLQGGRVRTKQRACRAQLPPDQVSRGTGSEKSLKKTA
jgi:hypothetical protein